jgi:hypothetical protein
MTESEPEKRVFYIDVASLSPNEAEGFIDRMRTIFSKNKYVKDLNEANQHIYNAIDLIEPKGNWFKRFKLKLAVKWIKSMIPNEYISS